MALDSQFGGNPVQGVQESPAPPYAPAGSTGGPGFLAIDVEDLPSANPAEPLYEFEAGVAVTFNTADEISARVAATAPTVFPVQKNGVANGNITVTGSSGVAALSSLAYAAGDLFSLYPPATADATLDGVRISLGTD